MTAVNKIDSNATGLAVAEEASFGVLPGTPTWNQLEPNEYNNFGGKLKLVARNPINSGRQRKKGVIVDLDATGGYTTDVTSDNTYQLMRGFMFAEARKKNELNPVPAVDNATNAYLPTALGAGYVAADLLFAKGFFNAINNGLAKVSGVPTGTSVPVTGKTLLTEAGSTGIVVRAGREYAAGIGQIDASGALPKFFVTGNVAGTQTLTATGQPANGDTITIGVKTYTFQTVLTNVDGNIFIGASLAATLLNIRNAINLNGLGVPGTDFALSTTINTQVTATATGTTLVVTAIVKGTSGNLIGTTKVGANYTWGAATLTGGAGKSLLDLGLIVGEFICVGDDVAGTSFATASNNGLKRVFSVDNDNIFFDKSTLAMVTDNGAGKTIRLIFGRVLMNEAAALQKRISFTLERTLGAPDDSSTNQQAEYLPGSICNQFELTVKEADKVTAKLTFVSKDYQVVTAGNQKSGNRPVLQSKDAFNSTSHVVRFNLAVLDGTAQPAQLFAFLMDLTLSINNNVKPAKAIKVLGAFDSTAGTLEVDANLTAYFANVSALTSVRNNADVTMDLTLANNNAGVTMDLPLLGLGDALANVKQDEPVTLPIKSNAATGSKLSTGLDHTLLWVYWDYLPTLAA
jgi:hypothetical protein